MLVISATCTAYYVMFGGFHGLWTAISRSSGCCELIVERFGLWVEFYYFATTTFCTVGFGDINPDALGSRILVTFTHFLTFGYVLFLLQNLTGKEDGED